jgi:hypothetical protein
MFKSDLKLAIVCVTLCAACSGEGGAPSQPPQTPNQTLSVEPLTDAELLGVPREQVLLTLPWSERVVSRDPAPSSARATLHSAEIVEGPTFDRATFEFGTDTDFPGYRIVWDDSTNAVCAADAPAADLGQGRTLLIRFGPATTRQLKGGPTITSTSRRPGLPSVATARQLCDEEDAVVWALSAADSAVFRVVEMHTPPRLVVDVAHPGFSLGSAAAPQDSAAPAPK